jgi:hypothetical protein
MNLTYACQQYCTCMCFLGFIRYNKTLIACRFRKYENVVAHEYHIPLGCCPQGIWYSSVSRENTFSYFPHQHEIHVYLFCRSIKNSYSQIQKPVIVLLHILNGEAICRSIPWSHQNDPLTDTIWYVSSISWRTYLEDNYIIFENFTASN